MIPTPNLDILIKIVVITIYILGDNGYVDILMNNN